MYIFIFIPVWLDLFMYLKKIKNLNHNIFEQKYLKRFIEFR